MFHGKKPVFFLAVLTLFWSKLQKGGSEKNSEGTFLWGPVSPLAPLECPACLCPRLHCVSVAIVLDLPGDILMSIGFSSSACVGDAVGASAAGTAGVEVAGSVGASTVDTVGVDVGIVAV